MALEDCRVKYGKVLGDKLHFRYVYFSEYTNSNRDAACVLSKIPFSQFGSSSSGVLRFLYFEVRILEKGKSGYVAIGLAPENYSRTSQPG